MLCCCSIKLYVFSAILPVSLILSHALPDWEVLDYAHIVVFFVSSYRPVTLKAE